MADVQLLGGPYRPPRFRVGFPLFCEWRGEVEVMGTTDAPIAWPYSQGERRKRLPVLTGDLVRAVTVESAEAVAFHWGISRWTVRRWRQHLNVPRFNPGTRAAWRRMAITKLAAARAAYQEKCSQKRKRR
jgi:hypothetical protein